MGKHLFINCPFSREVWDFMTKEVGISWCKPDNLLDFFSQWKSMLKGSNLQELGSWIMPLFCWGIWKERNNRTFREKEESASIVGKKTYKMMKENYCVRKGGEIEMGGKKWEKEKDGKVKR